MSLIVIPNDFSLETLVQVREINPDEDLIIDFKDCSFIYPAGMVSLIAIAQNVINHGHIIKTENESSDIKSYLSRMNFYQLLGLSSQVHNRNDSGSRFVEIASFNKDTDDGVLMQKCIDLTNCISKEIPPDVRESVGHVIEFCITEIVDNAKVHSKASNCFLMAQHYSNKGFVELCVVDNGIGMKESMKTETVEEALVNSINASTKGVDSPGAGNGLCLSSRMIKNGKCPKSALIIYSADRYLDIGDNSMFLKNSHLNWQGTIVVLRVGYGISGNFKETMDYDPEFVISYD